MPTLRRVLLACAGWCVAGCGAKPAPAPVAVTENQDARIERALSSLIEGWPRKADSDLASSFPELVSVKAVLKARAHAALAVDADTAARWRSLAATLAGVVITAAGERAAPELEALWAEAARLRAEHAGCVATGPPALVDRLWRALALQVAAEQAQAHALSVRLVSQKETRLGFALLRAEHVARRFLEQSAALAALPLADVPVLVRLRQLRRYAAFTGFGLHQLNSPRFDAARAYRTAMREACGAVPSEPLLPERALVDPRLPAAAAFVAHVGAINAARSLTAALGPAWWASDSSAWPPAGLPLCWSAEPLSDEAAQKEAEQRLDAWLTDVARVVLVMAATSESGPDRLFAP